MTQVLKLGLLGSETTLPDESRINEQGADTPFFNEARSANKTLHTDFIATKENHTISWEVISISDYDLVNNIIKLQYSGNELNFIYTDSIGTETNITARATVTNKGTLIQCGEYFYQGFSIFLEQV